MREIKFRAWNKKVNKWLGPNYSIEMNSGALLFHRAEYYEFIGKDPNIIICQYTGLKDKNGVNIYEGDIVKSGKKYWKIVFMTGCFVMCPIKELNQIQTLPSQATLSYFINEEIEIIGNIYENPDMVTK